MNFRNKTLSRLKENPGIPVLIAGAGINGAGLFRELSLQGIDALLVDKADLSAGASAAPSRMIHGGLRYLENREVRLVKESLKERNLLLKNAPHYVRPLPTVIPVFHRFSGLLNAIPVFLGWKGKSVNRGALLVRLGLTAYDFYTRKQRVMPRHIFQGKAGSLALRPLLNDRIIGTATYYDAWISYPERLCLELIRDGLEANPASGFLNYCALAGQGDDAGTVLLKEGKTGEMIRVKPGVVVNATGAWIDLTNTAIQQPTRLIGGTKGSHLMIDNEELMAATRGQMLFYENAEGRICILFPLHGKVLVGSTDIKAEDPETVVCDESEVDYMLESVRQIFPSIRIDRSQIVFRFSGVRPLPASSSETTARISRDHSLSMLPPSEKHTFPIYAMVGGKWTTFRAFAAHTAKAVADYLGRPIKTSSENIRIGGGKDFPETGTARREWIRKLHRKHRELPPERLDILLERYGTTAEQVAGYLGQGPDRPLKNHPLYSVREIEYLVRYEFVERLDDLLLRRTSMAMAGELSHALLQELSELLASVRGEPAGAEEELERTKQILYLKHGVKLDKHV